MRSRLRFGLRLRSVRQDLQPFRQDRITVSEQVVLVLQLVANLSEKVVATLEHVFVVCFGEHDRLRRRGGLLSLRRVDFSLSRGGRGHRGGDHDE